MINDIIRKHPSWKKFHGRRIGAYRDATSEIEWTGDLEVNNVDLYKQWIFGRADACKVLNVRRTEFDVASGYSMLRPNGRLVGVTIDVEREEVCKEVADKVDEPVESEIQMNVLDIPSEENEISLDIEEFLEENSPTFNSTVDVNGKMKHKATVVRELFNESGSSMDRLRRVRSYSKFVGTDVVDEPSMVEDVELDNMIMLGDNAGGNIMLDDGSTCLAIGKIVSMKDVPDKKFKTVISIAKVGDIVFQVCLYSGTTNMDFWF